MANSQIKLIDLPVQNTLTGNTKFVSINSDTSKTELTPATSVINLVGQYLANTTINVVRSSIAWFPVYVDKTITSIAVQPIDYFPTASIGTAKYTIQASSGAESQASELLVLCNGSSVSFSEYSIMYTGASRICTFNAAIAGANVVISVTPTNSTTTLKFVKVQIPK